MLCMILEIISSGEVLVRHLRNPARRIPGIHRILWPRAHPSARLALFWFQKQVVVPSLSLCTVAYACE